MKLSEEERKLRLKKYQHEYYLKNIDRLKKYKKEYNHKRWQEIKASRPPKPELTEEEKIAKEQERKEKLRAYHREYYWANIEENRKKLRERMNKRYHEDEEFRKRINANSVRWRKKNLEKSREKMREYMKNYRKQKNEGE